MRRPLKAPDISEIRPAGDVFYDQESMELARRYNERYLHWDRLQYHDCGRYGRESLWFVMKMMRTGTCKRVDISDLSISFNLPDRLQESLHRIDMVLSAGIWPMDGFDDKRRMTLSTGSMMEESIASSQMEGAVTTTRDAKRMLRNNIPPKNVSERMILGNYRAMGFIRSNLDRELTPGFIRELHAIVSHDTLEDPEYEGSFRTDDSIAVRDVITGETYHEPVSHTLIDPMIEGLCGFANDDSDYIHPVVKGILIHFVLAYIHPFMDGNGRVSRSLFYWYTMKKGYSIMEYLSVSKAIREHKGGYEEAYQLCETDGNDVTYFIDYNIRMILLSMDMFSGYLREKIDERRSARELADADDLTRRQADVLASLMNSNVPQSVYELASKMGVTPQTIRNDLNLLIDKGYVRESSKDGHKQRFVYSDGGKGSGKDR